MDQLIVAATLLALGFWLFQVVKGRRDTRARRQAEEARKQHILDESRHAATIPKDVIARMRQQAPSQAPQPPPPRKRKKR